VFTTSGVTLGRATKREPVIDTLIGAGLIGLTSEPPLEV